MKGFQRRIYGLGQYHRIYDWCIILFLNIKKPKISDFKLGNLDSLMFLNEQMLKMEAVVEGLLKKVER
jgi:hypothetical protein